MWKHCLVISTRKLIADPKAKVIRDGKFCEGLFEALPRTQGCCSAGSSSEVWCGRHVARGHSCILRSPRSSEVMAGPGQCCTEVTRWRSCPPLSTAWQLTSCHGSKMTSSVEFCVIFMFPITLLHFSFISDSEISFSLIFVVLCEGNILMVLIWYLKYEKYIIDKLVNWEQWRI